MSNKYRGIRNALARYQYYRYWCAGVWHQVRFGRFGVSNPYWVTDEELAELTNFVGEVEILETETWLG